MKNELNLSVETSDDEWFEIFSYKETETDLKDISELIIFKTNTDFYSNFHYNSSNETEDFLKIFQKSLISCQFKSYILYVN